ncbi:possible Annexin [Prochlorococcus marinus subsp. pastoris str. CCMP1986]|uniref:Possible Annexin n=2 Tax=Prochlorococcaceae TaxID=2881426 RepID=Q7TU34_PROMP|nr:putative Annexin [Prochlorococcus marinus str. EQPAC1]CAE19980.1 possible Annexin [Prochlorococcus marinus subsp. pastoris str. CCMP1986]
MLNFFSIVLIILIIFFIVIFKKKNIFNAFNKKKLYPIKEMCNENNIITSSEKINHNQNSANKYSEFYKRKLKEKMNSLFKGSAEDKLKALNLAEELADKSTLPILKKGLKEMNLQIVERSAALIRKFK